jgi:hypothetical protein
MMLAQRQGGGFKPSPRFLQTATSMSKIAPGTRRDTYREIAGFAVKRVVAAVGWIEPRNLRSSDARSVGINSGFIEIDRNLPRRAAEEVSAHDRALASGRCPAECCNSHAHHAARYTCRQELVSKHSCVHIAMRRSILKSAVPAKQALVNKIGAISLFA